MSVDLFVQAFENGEAQEIPTTSILECFEQFIAQRGEGYIDVSFGPQDSSTIYFAVDEDTDSGITVNRPCADNKLAKCLYALMKLGNFVFYAPGEDGFVVQNQMVISHMPEGMKDCLGEARVIDTEELFIEFYKNE